MDIFNYVIRSVVTNRVVYLKESMEGLKLFGVAGAIRSNPQAFQSLFTKDSQSEHVIDANYLVLVLIAKLLSHRQLKTTRGRVLDGFFSRSFV